MSEKQQPGESSHQKCYLCSKSSHGFRKPASWTEENREWVKKFTPALPLNALICEACTKFVKRHTGNDDIKPRWIPKEPKPHDPCMVRDCSTPSRGSTSIASCAVAQIYLDLNETAVNPLVLCNTHYQLLYREINYPSPCATCSSQPRYGEGYIRRCPDPDIITQYLNNTTGFDGILSSASKICKNCYEFHQFIIKKNKESPTLDFITSTFQKKIRAFDSVSNEQVTTEAYLDMLVAKAGLSLAGIIETDEAILLPVLHADFCELLQNHIKTYPNVSRDLITNPPTTNWLLSSLTIHFKATIGIVCKHKRFGTLVYRRGGDLLKALSKALGTAKEAVTKQVAVHKELKTVVRDINKQTTISDDQILQACSALSKRLQKQGRALVSTYQKNPLLCSTFNPESMLLDLDPLLVQCIKILTTPARDRRRLFDTSQPDFNLKSIKQLYCLSTLLFTANNQCHMPIHYLITDAVVCLGGSTTLVKFINRFGAGISLDTHNRIATWVVSERTKTGIQNELIPNTLTVVSIDNIDILQRHAMVATSQSKRSFHGTSIQSVQPLPDSSIMCDEETLPCNPPLLYEQDSSSCSPIRSTTRKHASSSPTMSPTVKQLEKRRRTLREQSQSSSTVTVTGGREVPADMFTNMYDSTDYQRPTISQFTIRSFRQLPQEETSLRDLDSSLFQYFCLKEAKAEDVKLPGLPSFVSAMGYGIDDTEVGRVVYVDIVSLPADSKDTILKVLHKLHHTFITEQRNRWLIVAGDAKTYDILQALKREYSNQIEWLLPLPGDWHILFNYQKVLIKIYGEAGLLQLAKVAGHRAETLTSLAQASHFKRTHNFILHSFEALHRMLLKKYVHALEQDSEKACVAAMFQTSASNLANKLSQISTVNEFNALSDEIEATFRGVLSDFKSQYRIFVDGLCSKQDTTRFWYDYISKNCMAYIALHTAIRNGDWVLRMAAIKMMAAIFSAFDRPIYQRLVPQHLADILCFPPTVLHHLKKGAISVHLTKIAGHAVAIDEAHEMKINKDAKFAIVRPSEQLMEKISNFMPFRAKCITNLKHQLGLEKENTPSLPTATSRDSIADQNIQAILDYMDEGQMLPDGNENLGLHNFLTNTQATPEQANDLMCFRSIGQAEFEAHINFRLLRTPSTNAPIRRKRLQTFSSTKSIQKRLKQLAKDKKIQQTCMKKQLVMLTRGEKLPLDYTTNFTSLPSALVGSNGIPYKGNKSKTTDFFETRYKTAGVIVSQFPAQWVPDSVILEGMFLIQTSPPPGVVTFRQYANMLLKRHVYPHVRAGVKELHILYDDPGQLSESPKEIERSKRDESALVDSTHHCMEIDSHVLVPTEWRKGLLNCRHCKRALCEYLSHATLELAPALLSQSQVMITAGGFGGEKRNQCWMVSKNGQAQPLPYLRSTSEETDLRIWLHCIRSTGNRKLLYSPDTDIYHIGLPLLLEQLPQADVYIQLKGRKKDTHRYICANTFLTALDKDPDLAQVPSEKRAKIVQVVYVATGCDYISYFKGIGKVFFLNVLFQHATFITSGDPAGTLADLHSNQGSLAFMRLVGSAYFKKHLNAFQFTTPESLYNSIESTSSVDHHKKWLEIIRKRVWERTVDESYYLPSYEALELHWKRCMWVVTYWSKSTQQDIVMPKLNDYGWYREDGILKVKWDTEENIQRVNEHVTFLTSGCKCKTGCTTRRCKCTKGNFKCGPSCLCVNCQNTESYCTQSEETEREVQDEILEEGEDEDYDVEMNSEDEGGQAENDINLQTEVDDIMEDIFGNLF